MQPYLIPQVREELGKGLTSTVYNCLDRFTDERYAVKIIDLHQTSDLNVVESIVNEVTTLSQLPHHPNIISLFKV